MTNKSPQCSVKIQFWEGPQTYTDDAKPCQKHIKAVVFRGIQMKSKNIFNLQLISTLTYVSHPSLQKISSLFGTQSGYVKEITNNIKNNPKTNDYIIFESFMKVELIFLPPKLTLKIENIQFLTGLTSYQKILLGGSFRYKNLQQIRQTYRTKY